MSDTRPPPPVLKPSIPNGSQGPEYVDHAGRPCVPLERRRGIQPSLVRGAVRDVLAFIVSTAQAFAFYEVFPRGSVAFNVCAALATVGMYAAMKSGDAVVWRPNGNGPQGH